MHTWSNNAFHVLLNNVHAPQNGIDTHYHIAMNPNAYPTTAQPIRPYTPSELFRLVEQQHLSLIHI
eukprot:8818069-Prorocentrum_lima.AAC.1